MSLNFIIPCDSQCTGRSSTKPLMSAGYPIKLGKFFNILIDFLCIQIVDYKYLNTKSLKFQNNGNPLKCLKISL